MISGSSGRCTVHSYSIYFLFSHFQAPYIPISKLPLTTNNHLSSLIIAKMHLPLPLLSILLLIPTFTLACIPTCTTPTPTRAFTVAAFESPWPPGSNNSLSHHVSGLILRAQGGKFWFDPDTSHPPADKTVLWVDLYGQAWLVSHVQLRMHTSSERTRVYTIL